MSAFWGLFALLALVLLLLAAGIRTGHVKITRPAKRPTGGTS